MLLINVFSLLTLFIYALASGRNSLLVVIGFLTYIALYLSIAYVVPDFMVHPADEEFFLSSANYLNHISDGYGSLVANLPFVHHDFKYYAYILFISVLSYPLSSGEFYQYANVILFQSIVYSFFFVWVLRSKLVNIEVFLCFVLMPFAFYSLFLYRDAFIAIFLFLGVFFLLNKKSVKALIYVAPVALLRVEFFLYFSLAIIASPFIKMSRMRLALISGAVVFFLIAMLLFSLHPRFDLLKIVALPFTINGEPFAYQLYLTLNSDSYYSGYYFQDVISLLVSFFLILFNAYLFGGLLKGASLLKLRKPSTPALALTIAALFYFVVMISYLTINYAFGMRVKLALIPMLAFAIYQVGFRFRDLNFITWLCFFGIFDCLLSAVYILQG